MCTPVFKCKKEIYVLFFGGISSRSSFSLASFLCIDIPMKQTTNPVIITIPNRMAVDAVFGNAKVSIRNTGTNPIAINFICISLICIVIPRHSCPVYNSSSFVAEPQMHFWWFCRCCEIGSWFHSDESNTVICLMPRVRFNWKIMIGFQRYITHATDVNSNEHDALHFGECAGSATDTGMAATSQVRHCFSNANGKNGKVRCEVSRSGVSVYKRYEVNEHDRAFNVNQKTPSVRGPMRPGSLG